MSREAYTPPKREQYTPPAASTVGTSGGATATAPRPPAAISYLCADCGASNSIGQKEQIRCRECGHRVMYKKRTRRMGKLLSSILSNHSAI